MMIEYQYRCIKCEKIYEIKEAKIGLWRKVKAFFLRRRPERVCPSNLCMGRLVKYIGREKMVYDRKKEIGKARLN